MVTRGQLLERGLTAKAVRHRVRTRRLHPVQPGVYAVGRPELTRYGRWMAAVLSCGDGAALSHESAAALWGLVDRESRTVISVPPGRQLRRGDIRLHRMRLDPEDVGTHRGIPVTAAARTLIDLAAVASAPVVEAAVNAADRLDLIDPAGLRREIGGRSRIRGLPALRRLLDRHSFRLTDSELERRFLRLVSKAGIPPPETGVRLNGFKVDFFWPELGLIVETDGLRYHRTASQQARDRRRDQAHLLAGLTTIRFTYGQIAREQADVTTTLAAIAGRLAP